MIIIENGEQMDLSERAADTLLTLGLIYDSGEGYHHLATGVTFYDVDTAIAVHSTNAR